MKILKITPRTVKNKSQRRILLSRFLKEFGHEVTIFATRNDNRLKIYREEYKGIEIYEFPDILFSRLRKGGFGPVESILRLFKLINKKYSDYDIIHTDPGHRPTAFLPAFSAKYLYDIPIVDEWMEWFGIGGRMSQKKQFWRIIGTKLENFFEEKSKIYSDGVIAISNTLKSRAEELGVAKKNILVLHGGADTENYEYLDKKYAKKKAGFTKEMKIIGLMSYDKNDLADNEIVLKAFGKILEINKNVYLLMTGKEKVSTKLKEKYKIHNNLIELGWLEYHELNIKLAAVDIFVLPFTNTLSNRARWPNKIGDYLAIGRPIISNPTGDIVELFQNHEIGKLVDESSEGMSSAIMELIEDENKLTQYGNNARDVADNEYSWLNISKKLETFLIKY